MKNEPVLLTTSSITDDSDWKSFTEDFPVNKTFVRLDSSVCVVTHYVNKGRQPNGDWLIQAWGHYVRTV